MSARTWAWATVVLGAATFGLFVVFAMLPEARAAIACMPAGAVVQFELASNVQDLVRVFGPAGSECRPLVVSAMDAVNHLDLIAFIPTYTLFCIAAALFLSTGSVRLLSVAAIGAALFAAAGDYLETTTLLAITQHLDAPDALLRSSQLGAWSKFALLAAHAVFCAGLCFTAEKPRPILGALLLLPAVGTAAAAYNHVTLANAMNGGFALAWLGLLVMALLGALRKSQA